jgi:hypothetical protein
MPRITVSRFLLHEKKYKWRKLTEGLESPSAISKWSRQSHKIFHIFHFIRFSVNFTVRFCHINMWTLFFFSFFFAPTTLTSGIAIPYLTIRLGPTGQLSTFYSPFKSLTAHSIILADCNRKKKSPFPVPSTGCFLMLRAALPFIALFGNYFHQMHTFFNAFTLSWQGLLFFIFLEETISTCSAEELAWSNQVMWFPQIVGS